MGKISKSCIYCWSHIETIHNGGEERSNLEERVGLLLLDDGDLVDGVGVSSSAEVAVQGLRRIEDLIQSHDHGVLETGVGEVLLGSTVDDGLALSRGQVGLVEALEGTDNSVTTALIETTRLHNE